MNDNPARIRITSFSSTVSAWSSPSVEEGVLGRVRVVSDPETDRLAAEMRPVYDFTGGVRGKYYARYHRRSCWQQILSYLTGLYR